MAIKMEDLLEVESLLVQLRGAVGKSQYAVTGSFKVPNPLGGAVKTVVFDAAEKSEATTGLSSALSKLQSAVAALKA